MFSSMYNFFFLESQRMKSYWLSNSNCSCNCFVFWMCVLLGVQQQYPLLGPPSTRMPQALASGSCQCQLSALQLPLHLQELETAGLGTITWHWHAEQHGSARGWCGEQTYTYTQCAVSCSHVHTFPFVSDQSAELQAQISNLFKSLTVQLQGALLLVFVVCVCVYICECFYFIKVHQIKRHLFSLLDMLNKCKGDLLEVKDNRCKTQPSLLESLVYFVEVRTFDFLSASCALYNYSCVLTYIFF